MGRLPSCQPRRRHPRGAIAPEARRQRELGLGAGTTAPGVPPRRRRLSPRFPLGPRAGGARSRYRPARYNGSEPAHRAQPRPCEVPSQSGGGAGSSRRRPAPAPPSPGWAGLLRRRRRRGRAAPLSEGRAGGGRGPRRLRRLLPAARPRPAPRPCPLSSRPPRPPWGGAGLGRGGRRSGGGSSEHVLEQGQESEDGHQVLPGVRPAGEASAGPAPLEGRPRRGRGIGGRGVRTAPPRAGGAARPASRRPASRGWLAGPQAGGRPGAGGLAGHLGEDRLLLSLGLWPKGGTGDRGWNGGRWASAPAGGPWLSVASGRSAAVGGGAAGAAPSAQLWRSPPRATVPLRQHLGDERHCRPRFGSSLGTVGVRCAALTFRRAGRGSGAAGSRPPPPGAPGCVPCPGRPAAPRVSARSLASCFFSSACRLWLLLDTHRCRLCACDIDARRCRLSCLVLRQEKNQAGSALLRSSADVK